MAKTICNIKLIYAMYQLLIGQCKTSFLESLVISSPTFLGTWVIFHNFSAQDDRIWYTFKKVKNLLFQIILQEEWENQKPSLLIATGQTDALYIKTLGNWGKWNQEKNEIRTKPPQKYICMYHNKCPLPSKAFEPGWTIQLPWGLWIIMLPVKNLNFGWSSKTDT